MYVLFETAAGYALFKVKKDRILQNIDEIWEHFKTPEKAQKVMQLVHFKKFQEMQEALQASTSIVEGKLNKALSKLIKKKMDVEDELAVADNKLGSLIQKKCGVNCIYNPTVLELMRGIRTHAESLIGSNTSQKEMTAMSVGLSHSLSRYKLKFSPDKVDVMITSGIGTLEDLDKELNNFVMRLKEWYGWHFPELSKLVTDNNRYVDVVLAIGHRSTIGKSDLRELLTEAEEKQVREAAEISMGTEIAESDLVSIRQLCTQIIEMVKTRKELMQYIQSRMLALAPNISLCVGEMIGAKLIAHAGSLTNLAKQAGSTVQILGAEKALFRALKKKQDTPKYGLLYHASIVGTTSVKNKGKVSRMVAAKAALLARYDAFAEEPNQTLGLEQVSKLQSRVKYLEEGQSRRVSGTGKAMAKHDKYVNQSTVVKVPEVAASLPRVAKASEVDGAGDTPRGKKHKREREQEGEEEEDGEGELQEPTPKKKKHKKSHPEETPEDVNGEAEEKKKKKKKKRKAEEVESD